MIAHFTLASKLFFLAVQGLERFWVVTLKRCYMNLHNERMNDWLHDLKSFFLTILEWDAPLSSCCLIEVLYKSLNELYSAPDYWQTAQLSLGLNLVPNFAEYRVFEAVFAEYQVPIPSIWQNVNIFNCINFMNN